MSPKGGFVCPGCDLPAKTEKFCRNCGRYNPEKADKAPPEGVVGFFEDYVRPGLYIIDRSWFYGESRWGLWGFLVFLGFTIAGLWRVHLATGEWNRWLLLIAGIMVYGVVVFLVNRTRVVLDPAVLRVQRGPLWFPLAASFKVPRGGMKRFDLAKLVAHGRHGTTISYPLSLVSRDDERLDVFTFDDEEQAKRFFRYLVSVYDIRAKGEPISREEVRELKESGVYALSAAYKYSVAAMLLLNLPALLVIERWSFDGPFWGVLGTVAALLFILYYFHHRRYLDFYTSNPLREGKKNAGAAAYAVISVLMALLLTPVAMAVRNLLPMP